jgi:hypothetical protein
MTSRTIGMGIAALLLSACALSENGLGPDALDDAGSPPLYAVDSSAAEAASAPAADAASAVPADAMTDASRVSIDARSVANATDASGGALEGGSCVLPTGATLCCGSVACTSSEGTCATAGVCALCQAQCTDPKKPVCCATSSTTVTCAATSDGC